MNKRTAAKQSTVKNKHTGTARENTGAPKAHFLSALRVEEPIELLIEQFRHERESLAAMPTQQISDRITIELLELAERVIRPKMTPTGLDQAAAEELAGVAIEATTIFDTGRNKRDRVRSVQNTPCEGQHFNNSFPLLINLFAAAAT